MRQAQLQTHLHAECFCPSCSRHLVPTQCADPWAIKLVCESDHHFFIMPEPPLAGDSAKASSLHFPELSGRSLEAIAAFWLSDPAARSVLNGQLALLLRAILEARRVPGEPLFSFCPECAGALSEHDWQDIWAQGLRCPSGHIWGLRGGRLASGTKGKNVELQAEFSDAVIKQLIGSWLKSNPHLGPNLHDSVRRVLVSSPLCPQGAH
jgi:hypothetical protein